MAAPMSAAKLNGSCAIQIGSLTCSLKITSGQPLPALFQSWIFVCKLVAPLPSPSKVTMLTFTFGCEAWYALASGSRTASTQTVKLPEAVLLGAGEPETGAVLAGVLLDALLAGADDALAVADDEPAGELEAAVELCFELEQPANANAVTRTGSHRRRCIFTAHSFTGTVEYPAVAESGQH